MGMLQLVTQRGVCLTHIGHVTNRDTERSVSHTQWACYNTRHKGGGVSHTMGMLQLVTPRGVCLTHDGHVNT